MSKGKLASFLAGIGGADKVIEKIGETVDRFVHTKEDKEQFKLELQKVLQQEEAQILKDKDSARNREIEVAKSNAGWLSKNIVPLLSIGVLLLTFGMFYVVMFLDISEQNRDFAHVILGVLGAMSTQIIAYYFGSSLGSKDKQGLIEKMRG